jgi:hypothetical protein
MQIMYEYHIFKSELRHSMSRSTLNGTSLESSDKEDLNMEGISGSSVLHTYATSRNIEVRYSEFKVSILWFLN